MMRQVLRVLGALWQKQEGYQVYIFIINHNITVGNNFHLRVRIVLLVSEYHGLLASENKATALACYCKCCASWGLLLTPIKT